jgi:hypothetical protein
MRYLCLLFILVFFVKASSVGYSPDEEQRLKFLYIKNFIKNIEWPPSDNKKEFKIVVYGNRSIYEKISRANIKSDHANGLNVAYYYFESHENLIDCQLIYVTGKKSSEIKEIITLFENKPVLIVSEQNGSCELGSSINFIKDQNDKLSFEYNQKAIKNSGLMYSMKFMEQGINVVPSQ